MALFYTCTVLLVCTCFVWQPSYATDNSIEESATTVGKGLSKYLLDKYFNPVNKIVQKLSTKIGIRTRKTVFEEVLRDLTTLFNERLSSVAEIADYAEHMYKNFTNKKKYENYLYFDARGGDVPVKVDDVFSNKVKVNLNQSAVQTPTDVYQYATKILNSIDWTKKIDEKMKEYFAKTKTKHKAWQYIGLSDGVFRTYPGSYWANASADIGYYDCRQRAWYIRGSAPPKDMVIVVDSSGSVTGNRLMIVKLAVISLIDTLQEDDFVNIIYFNKIVYRLKTLESYNWTNLVQATARNKKILKEAVQTDIDEGKDIANVASGFAEAFEILKSSRANVGTTSNCTQTIAFFTDGVEGDTVAEDIFSEYNPDKQIRVFSYLVGREKGSPFKAVKWTACHNEGYFYRIETLSDVRENIVKYVNVLSRSTSSEPKWTPLYLDAQGLGLMCSLVAPVFNTKESPKGEQLGVVGVDMMLDEILTNIPEYKIGVGGYTFSVTNNGLIFFHPLLYRQDSVNLHYTPDVYLSEIEHFPSEDLSELIDSMIDRKYAEKKLKSKYILTNYNGKWRIGQRGLSYVYGHIVNTSFSVAMAMADHGMNYIIPEDNEKGVSDFPSIINHHIAVANWAFCNETIMSLEELKEILKNGKNLKYCKNKELINQAKDDILDLKDLNDAWKMILDLMSDSNPKKLFFGTASGLTFRAFGSHGKKDESVFENPIKQEYYERAADRSDKKTVVFYALNKVEVSASKVVMRKDSNKEAIWGVVGIHFDQSKLQSIIKELFGCHDSSKLCYLVDEHGYIMASAYANLTGDFFGKVEGTVMKDLIHQNAYVKYEFTDVQAMCVPADDDESSSSIRILDPLYAFVNYAKWWTQTVALSLVQYSFYSILTGNNKVKADDEVEEKPPIACSKTFDLYIRPDVQKGFSNQSLVYDGCEKSYTSHLVNGTNLLLVIVAHENSTYCARRNEKISDNPRIVNPEPPSEMPYRQAPVDDVGVCYPKEKESGQCSSANTVLPSLLFFAVTILAFHGVLS